MRRLVLIVAVLALAVGGAFALGAGEGDDGTQRYKVELDNAFGLTEGADLRAAGVRVGSVEQLEVDARTARAIATVAVERPEFAGFRRDVFCVVEPQSLIGEYFMDCEPGRAPQRLPEGGTVPVKQTGGTIPPDLVNDVLRRPYRERLGILVAELGATFASRGEDVNASIARAIPALRETDEVLRILADERETLRELTRNGETVITRLARGREGLSRFISEARDTAAASADRRTDLAATIRDLPRFQRELQPTLRTLGTVARRQTPALADLRAAAPDATALLRELGPFSRATQPALRSLAATAVTGRRAVRPARPFVRQLRRTAETANDPLQNLRVVLDHLADRNNAVEPNRMSPEGKGFTGLEALLQYFFTQSQAINVFDVKGYLLKLNILVNECGQYTDARARLANPERAKRCNADLGPGAPDLRAAAAKEEAFAQGQNPPDDAAATRQAAAAKPAAAASAPAGAGAAGAQPAGTAQGGKLELPGLPPIELPDAARGNGATEPLLDLLLRP